MTRARTIHARTLPACVSACRKSSATCAPRSTTSSARTTWTGTPSTGGGTGSAAGTSALTPGRLPGSRRKGLCQPGGDEPGALSVPVRGVVNAVADEPAAAHDRRPVVDAHLRVAGAFLVQRLVP